MRSHHRWREEEEPRKEREKEEEREENKTDESVLQSIITERRRVCCERYHNFTERYHRDQTPDKPEEFRERVGAMVGREKHLWEGIFLQP